MNALVDSEESRRRYKLLISEVFRRAGDLDDVSLVLHRAGFARKSKRTMISWRALEAMPTPVELIVLVTHYEVPISDHLFGEAPPRTVADRVDRNSRDIAWLKNTIALLAARTGHSDLVGPAPPDGHDAEQERAEEEG